MKAFAELYANLDATTSSNAKLAALQAYFRQAPPDDAAWAVYFLSGGRPRQLVPTRLLRDMATQASGIEPWLFEESYQSVGDLAETISLLLPESTYTSEDGLAVWLEEKLLPLRGLPPLELAERLPALWAQLDQPSLMVCIKLITGSFRVGVSKLLVTRALAAMADLDSKRVAQRLVGYTDLSNRPTPEGYLKLIAAESSDEHAQRGGQPYPFFLAHGLSQPVEQFDALLGSLVATAINSLYSPEQVSDYAWRIPFLLGGVFGLLSVYLRRWLHETPIFAEMQQRKTLAAELPLRAVLRDHRGAIVLSMLLTWLLSAGVVVVILMTPTVLQTVYHFSPTIALQANSLAIVTLSLGCIASGALADRFGAGRVLVIGCLLLLATSWTLYHSLIDHPNWLFPLYTLTGLVVGVIGVVPYVMVKAFPPVVRFSGLSFSYNVAYAVFGGLTPLAVSLLMKESPMGPAYYVAVLCVMGMLVGGYLWKRGR